MSLSMPAMTYRVAFASDPLAASPTWTIVTNLVLTASVKRGVQHELGTMEAGTADIVFDNRERDFDPTNTSSPYSPNLLPGKQVQIQATYGGTTYGVYTGYVNGWPISWDDPVTSTAAVKAADGFVLLNRKKLYDSVALLSPNYTFRFSEAAGGTTTATADSSGTGTLFGQAKLGAVGLLPADSDTAVDVGAYNGYLQIGGLGGFVAGSTKFTFAFWIYPRTNSNPGGSLGQIVRSSSGGTAFLQIALQTDQTIQATGNDGTTAWTITSTATAPLLEPTHVALTYSNLSNTLTLYINGVADATATPGSTLSYSGLPGTINIGTNGGGIDGIIDEFVFFPTTEASAANITTIYGAALGLNSAAATGTRIGKALDIVGWPAGARSIDAGAFTMQRAPFDLYNQSALAHILALTKSEGAPALAFIDGSGNFVFHDRAHAPGTSAATFGDGVGELPYRLEGIEIRIDDLDIYNEVVAQARGGVTQVAVDTSSQTAYSTRSLQLSNLENSSDTDVSALANAIVSRYKTPRVRISSVSIHPLDDPTNLFPQALGRELGDRITVKRASFPSGPTMQTDYYIEGIEHRIDVDEWVTTWHLVPVELFGFFTLDDAYLGDVDAIPLVS